jgi:hypothetical protein
MFSRPFLVVLAITTSFACAQNAMTNIDAANIDVTYSSGMDFETGPGELHATTFNARSFLGQPWELGGDWKLASELRYRATFLDGEGLVAGFPFNDETLQTISLRETLLRISPNSPWIYGGWAQASLSSDFQDLGGDAFLFDVGLGGGYKFSDRFTLLVMASVLDLNGDTTFMPGIGLDWQISECVSMTIFGPSIVTAYRPNEDWRFSLKAESGGGVWNIDGRAGRSERLEFRSHQIGLHAERRLTDNWWLDVGAGISINNKIEIGSTSGITNFKDHMDDGWFITAGLRLAAW